MHPTGCVSGMQFLDEKDNELAKWEYSDGTWQPAKDIPAGFEIIGLYGDSRKDFAGAQFGFLLWNPRPSKQN